MAPRAKSGFRAKDFPLDTTKSNVSKIDLSTRYPETGFALNTRSEMVVYVLDGTTQLYCGEKRTVHKGAVILIKKGEKYFWQPHGKVTLLIFNTPPWVPEQQRFSVKTTKL